MGQSALNPEQTRDYTAFSSEYYELIYNTQIPPNISIVVGGKYELDQLQYCLKQKQLHFEDKIFPYRSLIDSEKKVSWLRLSKVFPGETFLNTDQSWEFSYESNAQMPLSGGKLSLALLQLKNYPKVLDKICPQAYQPNSTGLYRFFVNLGGIEQQIIIDDFIPVTKVEEYFYDRPNAQGGFWMILLAKAMAKLMGSYEKLGTLSETQILSELTGYPCMELYEQDHEKVHAEMEIHPKESKYFRIRSTSNTPLKLVLCLWFKLDTKDQSARDDLVVELVDEGETQKIELKQKEPADKNMVVMTSLEGGLIQIGGINPALLHIYSRASSTVGCNLVVQADGGVHVQIINEQDSIKYCKNIKTRMIISEYKSRHCKLPQIMSANYKLRIAWMGHRGVFCIKNKLLVNQKFVFRILQPYRNQIHFEDSIDVIQQSHDVKPNSHWQIILNREKDQQYGAFYTLLAL